MRRDIRGVRLKHLNASGRWPSGNVRFYYRPKGRKGIPLPDLPPDHPDWLAAYAAAASGKRIEAPQPQTGTIAAGIAAYLASDVYLGLGSATRGNRRLTLDRLRRLYGDGSMATLRTQHIRQDLAKLPAHPANNRLKVWRGLCKWWVSVGLIETDPARDVERRRTPPSEGARPWTRDDMAAFREHWSVGTAQRLAFELLYQSCAAIGDMTRLGPGNVTDGWLVYTRQKSRSVATCPWTVPAPEWFEASPFLAQCIEAAPRGITFLLTAQKRPRSAKSAASWFSGACCEAGLPGLSAHGLRKGRAAMFRENGAQADQRMAILGHETAAEAAHYAKSADLRRIVSGTEKFQLATEVGTSQKKVLKIK